MSIKILLLKSNEEIITEAKEIANPDSPTAIGYHLHKPFRLEIVSDEGELIFNREKGYQLSWFPWAPLSKDKDFFLPADHVITAYDPLDSIMDQYIQAIKEDTYDENFKKHEDVIAGVTDDDLDMEQIFKDAEKILDDEET
ncbi:hypothetical protein PHM2_151 [Prochlorococcus phage P-HM2]|uniref:Uncharacterized protein n=1 Tax=Prochlorococcus phage P-HM2 TaxID=445696 RepID=E3ST01_9CAUD|nr:hypothetical protein PHM2_151 [Prochlorococcus phage P-HM2]ADO99929.1 hypothetical protein PHM2_151 [Prochlorococcus phage P-HM2]|tara:strand:+ start:1130 stop:1552 length:423 start_codon:yes stop_codon:yes gene_type:complete